MPRWRKGLQILLGGFDSYTTCHKEKEMTVPVPNEYENTVAVGSEHLSNGADLVMWVAELLGNDSFELDTAHGFKITISKNADNEAVLAKQT